MRYIRTRAQSNEQKTQEQLKTKTQIEARARIRHTHRQEHGLSHRRITKQTTTKTRRKDTRDKKHDAVQQDKVFKREDIVHERFLFDDRHGSESVPLSRLLLCFARVDSREIG